MNPYTLEFSKYSNDIVDALIEVYGGEFTSLIDKRYRLIYFVPYVNYEGINSYYRFLIACKSRELSLKMLKIIGVDVDKYQVTNYADDFDVELKDLCEKLLGGSYSFESLFHDTPYAFRGFISKYTEGYSDDYILEQKLTFINAVKAKDIETINADNIEEFSKTDEYKRIEALAIYYCGIYDALLEQMKAYEERVKEYKDYYKKELDRKREILEKQRIKLFHVLEDGLKGRIKKHIDSLGSEEEKTKALLSSSIEYTSDIEYFGDEYESKLDNSETDENSKKFIYTCRMKFFRDMGADVNPWEDSYEEVIKREDIKCLVVYSVFANEITRLRKLYLEEAQKEFLLDGKEYKDALSYFADNQVNKDAIYHIMSKTQVCVNGGYNSKYEFVPIVYYTVRYWQCGCMDYVLLHEIIHAIECVSIKSKEHSCGFEPNVDKPEYSTNEHHETKRKYERLNEVITDLLAIETVDILHKKGIYVLDDKLLSLTNVDDFNTSKILKDLVRRFYRKYRKLILESRLKGDLSCLTDYIGRDNFDEFNDIIDKIDVLIEKGLADKLRDNIEVDPLIVQYNELRSRLRIVYRNMDEIYDDSINRYSGYYYGKRRYGK